MQGLNKRLFFPTLLLSIMGMSGGVLASISQSPMEEAVSWEYLPETQARTVLETNQELAATTGTEMITGTEALTTPEVSTPTPSSTVAITTTPNNPPTTSQGTPVIPPTPSPVQTSATETPEEIKETVEVTLVIQGPGISLKKKMEVKQGTTVSQVMRQASQTFDFSLTISHHSSLGVFIEGIAGTSNNPGADLYWLYYLNGQFASRGVSLQEVEDGDLIKWSYE